MMPAFHVRRLNAEEDPRMKLRGLRQARQRNGLSLSQLATLTGLRRDVITHLEQGRNEPQPYEVQRLTAALGATVTDLVGIAPLASVGPASLKSAS
jgi:transcriptional regulator with XRE-family HTH domain